MTLTTVVIADDHPPQRAGIRAALEEGGFHVCAEVGDGLSAIEAVVQHRPEVALLDIHMPGGGGISAAGVICEKVPETAVVMLTVSQDDNDLFSALRAGAAGYLLKDTDPARLPLALEGVLRGEGAIPRMLVSKLVEEFRNPGRRKRFPLGGNKRAQLTSREWEILELLRQGLSTKEIGEHLYVTPVTVRTHISSLLKKLKVSDREAAIRLMNEGSDS